MGGRDGLAALVGGLGLGFTAHAALATGRVGRLRVVERVPEVIGWFEAGKVPLAAELTGDPRVTLAVGDVYAELLGPPGADRWDAILIDVDHSPTERLDEASAPFYTEEGLRRVAEHLAPGGVLAVWSAEDDEPFFEALGAAFAEASRERVRWRNELIDDGQEVEDVLFLARR